jgi:MoaA/NifB/PqqE/SkfB family radical SAM enzyme
VGPRILKLELTSRCNARCVFCGHPDGGQDMSIETFCAIVDAFPGAEEVQPQFYGEPLMSPHIAQAALYARNAGKRVVFYTNGSLLTGQLAQDVAEARPNRVIFSIDTHIPYVYEAIRPPLSFAKLVENVARFSTLRHPGTKTTVAMLRTAETKDTVEAGAKFWRAFVDEVYVRDEQPRTRTVGAGDYPSCTLPDRELVVRADGSVVYCCNDWHSEAVIGHISEGLRLVWERQQAIGRHAFCDSCARRR